MRRRPRGPVILLGSADDPHVLAVARHLADQGSLPRILDGHALADGAPFSISLDGRGWRIHLDGDDLTAPSAVYVRQLPAPWPGVGTDDGEPVVLARWMTPYMLSRERDAALRAVLLHWRDAGVRLLNPPDGDRFSRNKAHQLDVARRLGVPVPETCITNDVEVLRAFVRGHRDVALKPLDGGALTQRLRGRVPARVAAALHASPVIAQRFIPGANVRLYMLDGKVLSCARILLPRGQGVEDFRASDAYQDGRARYAPVDLPAATRKKAHRWMQECGLVFAGLDLRMEEGGGLAFLEMNSSPIFMDQEEKTGHAISAGVARWLAAA